MDGRQITTAMHRRRPTPHPTQVLDESGAEADRERREEAQLWIAALGALALLVARVALAGL